MVRDIKIGPIVCEKSVITEKKDNGVIIVVFCLCNICATRGEISLNDGSGYLNFYWRKVLTYIV